MNTLPEGMWQTCEELKGELQRLSHFFEFELVAELDQFSASHELGPGLVSLATVYKTIDRLISKSDSLGLGLPFTALKRLAEAMRHVRAEVYPPDFVLDAMVEISDMQRMLYSDESNVLGQIDPAGRESNVLVAMLENRIVDLATRKTQDEIIEMAFGASAASNDHRRVFSKLKQLGLIQTGENGRGSYLTPLGKKTADTLAGKGAPL